MQMPFDPANLERLKADLSAAPRKLLVNGELVDARSGETIDVVDPATGRVFASTAAGGVAEIDAAVAAARAAFPGWATTLPAQRSRLLHRLADLIERDGERIALTESMDNGMPFMMAKFAAVLGAAEQLRYNAGWATKLNGETITPSAPGEWHCFTSREPVGVVGAITPWNFPFVMAVAKLAPALAAGCTVVLKPAEQTPLTAAILAELALEAGFPAGVINIVNGLGTVAGQRLVDHPDVDKISFTGSTLVGKNILRASTGNLKRVTLELGGKSPVFIFPDADLSRAIPGAAMGIFGNAGQVCAAGSRLFVHEAVYDRVLEGIAERARTLKVGPGLAAGTEMGPLVSEKQRERVLGYIQSGLGEGAGVEVGGEAIGGDGYFVQPTVLTGTAANMQVVREEIFGPVLSAMRFGDDDLDALAARGNDTDYGLNAVIWSGDLGQALKLAKRLRSGNVRINGGAGVDPAIPFGGYKQSGIGRENGRNGVESFTEVKSVLAQL